MGDHPDTVEAATVVIGILVPDQITDLHETASTLSHHQATTSPSTRTTHCKSEMADPSAIIRPMVPKRVLRTMSPTFTDNPYVVLQKILEIQPNHHNKLSEITIIVPKVFNVRSHVFHDRA